MPLELSENEEEDPKLEFALTELFNYYARTYEDKPKDFDHYHTQLFTISLRGYIAFTKDMEIPIDKARVIEVFKKASTNHQPHNFDQFKNSLGKLAESSLKHLQE